MMMNLFNIFDPTTTFFNLEINWLSSSMIIIFMPNFLWIMPNRMNMIMNIMMNTLNKEILLLFKMKNFKSPSFMFIVLFIFILMNNFISLFPYIFSSSSHMIFSMSLAMPFWLFNIIYSIMKNTKNMISHLIPINTPIYLAPLMTLIETMSILIRPLSLSIRLTANLIAGHLLMTLLNFNSMMMIIIMIQMLMMMFELCVAFIQSYVFSILTSLYSSE
uniref:ATP synthase subunit a n=1 Tax=Nurudea yanoniella TaxID=509176 RepID=A0A1Z1MWP3_9HEMI|nr:ATP synthase F0 subunit 6 [Nurudea yanoniella]ARW70278.1 ATP synthase F0 subunit 6 [Nurudea yanoniella]QBK84295.1 ATP synthase F0 subunit 6 [Nurudea yanoniella]